MELVVDANILIAACLRPALTRELLLNERLQLWTPEHNLRETERVLTTPECSRRLGGLSQEQVESLLNHLTSRIQIIPEPEYHRYLAQALRLAPHTEDAPYLALALHLHIPLWSNDIGLKQQGIVPVYATHDLLKILSIGS